MTNNEPDYSIVRKGNIIFHTIQDDKHGKRMKIMIENTEIILGKISPFLCFYRPFYLAELSR